MALPGMRELAPEQIVRLEEDGPAVVLLTIVEREPETALRALHAA